MLDHERVAIRAPAANVYREAASLHRHLVNEARSYRDRGYDRALLSSAAEVKRG